MPSRIPTLLLEANGTHWVAVAVETTLRGVLRVRGQIPESLARVKWARKLLGRRYEEASYMDDWKDAFCSHPRLTVTTCNIADLVAFRRELRRLREYAAVIVLHSAAGDRMSWLLPMAERFRKRRGALAVFVGNEYDLMADKIRFINESGADFVCSQLPLDTAEWLYAPCPNARVIPTPHALNPTIYRAPVDGSRDIDLGFVGDLYDRLIGDRERSAIVEWVRDNGSRLGLTCDIRQSRMRRLEWAAFLASCRGVIGAESGTYYLDRDGSILTAAKKFLRAHPDASFDEVFEQCYAQASGFVSGKAISSRHFEPVGTQTCQVLVEGRYNDILRADLHYIAVRPDLSNIEQAIERFRDPAHRTRIAEAAYQHVMDGHTYRHRVDAVIAAIERSTSGAAVPATAAS
jgi:hypothetical protein